MNTSPSIVFPMATGSAMAFDAPGPFPSRRLASLNFLVASICRRRTSSRERFGISTPMAVLPGIGAMMRMPEARMRSTSKAE